MHDGLVALYHKAPPPMRSAIASIRGWHLRGWRYGPETDGLVDAAHSREQWNLEEWTDWQGQRLERVLHRAATRVPYYRAQWAARRRQGDRASWSYLENWPVLRKQQLRAHPEAFVADDMTPRRMFRETTSGTTGTPVTLWFTRSTGSRVVCALRSPLETLVRREPEDALGAGRRPARRARPIRSSALLGLERRPAAALHVVVPPHARLDSSVRRSARRAWCRVRARLHVVAPRDRDRGAA